jgi:sugar lactone lactonase YvrE
VSKEGTVELLTDEADGQKFRTTDGVDVAENGIIYFTDASYKYSLRECSLDILEGKPHGRLMSYDPATKRTKVLLHDLYFANGVAVSPDQNYVVFCETPVYVCC